MRNGAGSDKSLTKFLQFHHAILSRNLGENGQYSFESFEKENVMCPLSLRYRLFTIAATDNIDANPNSDTAVSLFYDIATSINQHINKTCRNSREIPNTPCSEVVIKKLPHRYINDKPAYLRAKVSMMKPASIDPGYDQKLREPCANYNLAA